MSFKNTKTNAIIRTLTDVLQSAIRRYTEHVMIVINVNVCTTDCDKDENNGGWHHRQMDTLDFSDKRKKLHASMVP